MGLNSESFNYPVMLNLRDRLTVVVGAGTVGQRKLQGLLQAGARVRLVDPKLARQIVQAAKVESLGRCFEEGDLLGASLVFACSDSESVNQRVVAAARQFVIPCCCVDQPLTGDFALPAVYQRDSLLVAVSTGGGSPGLATEIRNRLAEQIPDYWGFSVAVVAAIRQKWLTEENYDKYNQQVLRRFWTDHLLPLLEQEKYSDIDQLLVENFGHEFSLEQLQVQRPEGRI